MVNKMKAKKENKVSEIYLIIVLGVCYLLGLLEVLTNSSMFYQILGISFTFIPVLAALITKRVTKYKAKYHLSLCVWKNMKYWLFSAFVPSVLIAIGATFYYLIFTEQYSGVFKIGMRFGINIEIAVGSPVMFALVCIIVSAIMIPIQLLELGEELGWRGYLLGFQVDKYGERKASLINGIEWGLAHLPLVYFGFNYSLDNWGAPWSNMIMMMVTCVVLGIILSYVTIKTGNSMYAAIIHGVVNIIGELPLYISIDMTSGILGPNPTGLLAMLPLLILAIYCFLKLESKTL